MPSQRPAAAVIVLGFGVEDYLESCLEALMEQLGPADELVLVDNGIMNVATRERRWDRRIRVLRPEHNLGFAGGTTFAASQTTHDVLVFVNSDAIVRQGSLDAIVRAAADKQPTLVGGCLRLADQPDLINSAGNPLHFTGITWAGHCGEPARNHERRAAVAVASGGFCALSRMMWDSLGGFDPLYFAYHEDTDLSIRARLAGFRVMYEPCAVADHHYDFGRSPLKMYLVERNRLITVLTDYPAPLLRVTIPVLVPLEAALFLLALKQGWSRQKMQSWRWVVSHRRELRARRRRVQAQVSIALPASILARQMTSRVQPPMVDHPPGMGAVNAVFSAYWRAAARLLPR